MWKYQFTHFLIEFLDFRKSYFSQEQQHNTFEYYLRMGGFPVIHTTQYAEETAYKVVYDIYSSVILRDTVQRYKIRDVELLERVIKYAFDNIGNTFQEKMLPIILKVNSEELTSIRCIIT
jgi:predicted AAA+ superfamily ATPase